MNIIGGRIKYLRRQKGVLQIDIANYLDISRTTFSGYERGEIIPPYTKMLKMAEYFNVTVDYIMGVTNDAKSENSFKDIPDIIEQLTIILNELTDDTMAIKCKGVLLDKSEKQSILPLITSSINTLNLVCEIRKQK